jgi:transketolase
MSKLTHPFGMRGMMADLILEQMEKDERVWVVVGDLGYGMWNRVREAHPDRFLNAGAAEQAMMGVAVGLALRGKIPVVYSITPFLLYRAFETIRNYLHHEHIPVKLIGSGRDTDYHNEGFSHWACEDRQVMGVVDEIQSHWPDTMEELPDLVRRMFVSRGPWYVNLRKA